MSENSTSLKKYIQPAIGVLVGINFLLAIFLMVKVRRTPKVGYVDTNKIVTSLIVDVRNKNREILQPKITKLDQKIEKYAKLKKDFERKKARGKSSNNSKTASILEKLEKEIEEDNEAISEEFRERSSKDIDVRSKDIIDAIEYVRVQNKCDFVFHPPIILFLYPIEDKMNQTISGGDTQFDLTKQVLDKLGLQEVNEKDLK